MVENARREGDGPSRGTAPVIGCDTDVVLDGKALGKPVDARRGAGYLDRLSGRAHEVLSGLVVAGRTARSAAGWNGPAWSSGS